MIVRLFIKNLVLVECAELTFDKGFTVITGETGAGKSIVLSSFNLLLGERKDTSLIRSGAECSIVEATFIEPKIYPLLDEAGIAYDTSGEVVVRRELHLNGKSRAFINDQTVQIAFLKRLAPYLIEVSAQHAHIELTSDSAPGKYLDAFCDNSALLADFQSCHQKVLQLEKQKRAWQEEEQARTRKIETAKRQIDEIEEAAPTAGEDEQLFSQYSSLSQIVDSQDQIAQILAILDSPDESALTQIGRCKPLLDKLPHFKQHLESFKAALSTLQDIAFELAKAQEASLDAQTDFARIDERLKLLHDLKKKYGPTLDDVLTWKEQQKEALKELESQSLTEDELDALLSQAKDAANKKAKELSNRRKAHVATLSNSITSELIEMNMPGALFEVVLVPQERTMQGDEAVEFYLTANKGEARASIQSAASGGELARLSLAIKCVMMDKNPVGTILFDEIDANIGGNTATIVGKKLAKLGKSCQVLAISHFSQVAVSADNHYSIQKQQHEGRTLSHIQLLDTEAKRHAEMNRMLGLAIFEVNA